VKAGDSSRSDKDDLASQMSEIKYGALLFIFSYDAKPLRRESDPPEKQNKKMRKLLKKLETENKKLSSENKALKEKVEECLYSNCLYLCEVLQSKDRLKTVEAQKKEIALLKKRT
jgi:hypothetical protein